MDYILRGNILRLYISPYLLLIYYRVTNNILLIKYQLLIKFGEKTNNKLLCIER